MRNTEEYFNFKLLAWNKKKKEHSAIGITLVILLYRLQVDCAINRRFHTENIVIMIIKNVRNTWFESQKRHKNNWYDFVKLEK